MKLRNILKLVAFMLLITGTLQAAKHPLQNFLLSHGMAHYGIGSYILYYYQNISSLADITLYILFALYINQLDSKFPKAHFGKYFRYDIVVTIINAIVIRITYEDLTMGFIAKSTTEILAVITTFCCGLSIYATLRNNGMKMVRNSYWLLSARHLIYTGILLTQILCVNLIEGYTADKLYSPGWMLAQWILLMPIMFVSRITLFTGTMRLKSHKHKHHHHSHPDSVRLPGGNSTSGTHDSINSI